MQNGLSSKDLSILEDQLTHEALAKTLASHHRNRYETLFNYLNGQQ